MIHALARRSSIVPVICLALCVTCCDSSPPKNRLALDGASTVRKTVEDIPLLDYMSPPPSNVDVQLLADALERYSTSALRAAIAELLREWKAQENYSVDAMNKLLILNRLVFQVSDKVPNDEARLFGGWFRIPQTATDTNLLWPLAVANSRLVLVGPCGAYNGADFLALEEFDFFAARYPRRTGAQ